MITFDDSWQQGAKVDVGMLVNNYVDDCWLPLIIIETTADNRRFWEFVRLRLERGSDHLSSRDFALKLDTNVSTSFVRQVPTL